MARGLAVWDHRLLESEPVPESIRYEALKRDGRCLLLRATKDDERLEVAFTRVLTRSLATCGTDGDHEPLP